MRPSSNASSISFVKSPLPPIFARGTSRILSPVVLIGTSSTVSPDHRFSNSLLVQLACQSASALPRVPSLSLPSMAALNPSMGANTLFGESLSFDVEDFPDEIGEISPFGIVGHLFQMLNGRMQNLVHD